MGMAIMVNLYEDRMTMIRLRNRRPQVLMEADQWLRVLLPIQPPLDDLAFASCLH